MRTELYEGSVTTSGDGPEAGVGVAVGCGEGEMRSKAAAVRTPHTPPQVHVLRVNGSQKAEAA